MVVCHLPYGPTAYFGIFNTVLRHDIGEKKEVGTVSEAYPHLIFDQFSSKLGERWVTAIFNSPLSHCFLITLPVLHVACMLGVIPCRPHSSSQRF